jgi:hypothetical protein
MTARLSATGVAVLVALSASRLPTVAGAWMATRRSQAGRRIADWFRCRRGGRARPRRPPSGGIELADDQIPDVGLQSRVRARDELAQDRHQLTVLVASRDSFGSVVWIMPAELSGKPDSLITRAHGRARKLAMTCSRYCSSSSWPGSYSGLVTVPNKAVAKVVALNQWGRAEQNRTARSIHYPVAPHRGG